MDLVRRILLGGLVSVAPLVGCSQAVEDNSQNIVCESPYIRQGLDCCLDQDLDGICDRDDNFGGSNNAPGNNSEQYGIECMEEVMEENPGASVDELVPMQFFCYDICDDIGNSIGWDSGSVSECKDGVLGVLTASYAFATHYGESCVEAGLNEPGVEDLQTLCLDGCEQLTESFGAGIEFYDIWCGVAVILAIDNAQ